jgi:hypothetical protein
MGLDLLEYAEAREQTTRQPDNLDGVDTRGTVNFHHFPTKSF